MQPKVLIIHTGGTFGMKPAGSTASLGPGPSLGDLLRDVPELEALARLTLHVAFNRDSSTLEPEHCLKLARLVRQEASGQDGIVIVHGTDTMAFTASVLGFLLADLGKPVVLTGSQRPLALVRSDARGNLVDAVSLAASGIAEVGIAFGDHWLRGVASDKVSIHRYEAFETPNLPPLAELGVHIRFNPHAGTFKRQVPEAVGPRLESSLAVMTPFPGMPWMKAGPGIRGVVIQAFGAGNLPLEREDLLDFLGDCAKRDLPVVITSQCLSGGVDLSLYELGRKALEMGCIPGGLHTRWAALAKLGLGIAAGMDVEAIRAAFATSWAGEPI